MPAPSRAPEVSSPAYMKCLNQVYRSRAYCTFSEQESTASVHHAGLSHGVALSLTAYKSGVTAILSN